MNAQLTAALGRVVRGHRAMVWAFDLDGTLIDLAATPTAVRVPADLVSTLNQLNAKPGHHVLVVSGRSRDNLRDLLGSAFGGTLIGNHGADWLTPNARPPGAWAHSLHDLAERHPGTWLEDKGVTWAFHWRQAERPEAVQRDLRAWQARHHDPLYGARQGHRVLDVAPCRAHKGRAVWDWMLSRGLAASSGLVVMGDDATDEHLFALAEAARLAPSVSVVVGTRTPTRAHWRVESPSTVRRLITWAVHTL